MSERGSFVTEYIYCSKCFEAAKGVLLGDHKYLKSVTIPIWSASEDKHDLPIIAGKVGGLYSSEELDTFEQEFVPQLAEVICHKMRIAVLADTGERIFTVWPK